MSDPAGQPPFPSFREAFCYAYHCDIRAYPRRALVKAVPFWRRPYVIPAIWVMPETFGMDIHIIELLGNTRSKFEFSQLLDEFYNAMAVTRSWSKRWLGLRMSGARLVVLRDQLDSLILPGERPANTKRNSQSV